MKLLLDENLPKQLKAHLTDHEVYTVTEMGWNGILEVLKSKLSPGPTIIQ